MKPQPRFPITFMSVTELEEALLKLASRLVDEADRQLVDDTVQVLTRFNIALSDVRRVVERL